MITKTLLIDKKINLLQEVRVIQALSELGIKVIVPFKQRYKFLYLQKTFGMILSSKGKADYNISECLAVNHEIPQTSIFGINKPIIIPASISSYLYGQWKKEKKYQFSFAGLITLQRKNLLQKWLDINFKDSGLTVVNKQHPVWEALKKLVTSFRIPITSKTKYGKLLIWNSNRGRLFPGKSWDEAYYRTLLDSNFVLCPNGDFIWSYRFFESILCGAIPVIEEYCPAYQGFKFRYIDEQIHINEWTIEDAEFNYNLAVERLVLSKGELENSLSKSDISQ